MSPRPLRLLLACALTASILLGVSGCEVTDFLSDASSDAASDARADTNNSADDNTTHSTLPAEAQQLYDLIMAYRAENGLPAIPLSPALTQVAQAHVSDHIARGDEVISGACNAHSWSDQGNWTGCCYTSDHAQARCMWDKPRELTQYTGNGYEISVWGSGSVTPASALDAWKGSPGHNSVILNLGTWDQPWQAIGVAIEGGYAHVWFGHEPDPSAR